MNKKNEKKCHKILIVDDDPAMLSLMSDILASHNGFEVRTETLCSDGLVSAEKWQPELLILGYNNADMNGKDVCEVVKQNPALSGIRILGMSGNCETEKAVEWINAGADAFMKKPFDVEELFVKIDSLLSIESEAPGKFGLK